MMKKFSNTVHIGKIRRRSLTPKLNEDQSSSNVEEQTNHQPIEEQVCE
jgi:hypothetical protein